MALTAEDYSQDPRGKQVHFTICYDIADDRRRQRVANLLGEFGPRVQLSVFEGRARSKSHFEGLLSQLRDLIDPHMDQVRVYRLTGPGCADHILGNREIEEWRDYLILGCNDRPRLRVDDYCA